MSSDSALFRAVADNPELLKVAHRKIEAALIDLRDKRVAVLARGNGLVIREADGQSSDVMRLTVPEAIQLALTAIAEELDTGGSNP